MQIYQSNLFERRVKKFNEKEKFALDDAIREIVRNPFVGFEKKGDLRGVFVHKFNIQNQMYLLAYRFVENESIELIMLGPHENYYRDLKSYFKNN